MAEISGFGGHISKGAVGGGSEAAIGCVREWSINETAEQSSVVCSSSQGAVTRVAGNKDWTGQYSGYGPLPSVLPGDEFEFEGAITGSGGSAVGVKGDAICNQIQVAINIETGEAIAHTVQFGALGALTRGTVTVPADTGLPNPYSAAGLGVLIAADPFSSFAAIHSVKTATLTISRANQSYASSNTSGHMSRKIGNLDVQLALACYAKDTDGFASFPIPNSIYAVQMQTNLSPAEHWLLKWMMFQEFAGSVNIEDASIVECTLSSNLTAHTKVSGVNTVGVITKPGGGNIWPPA